jgi:arabinofuranan 3-O-arabinosyltransferase
VLRPLATSATAQRRFAAKGVSLLERRVLVGAWTFAVLSFGTSLVPVVNGSQGYDTAPLTTAVHALLNGHEVYTSEGAGDFLYPPSGLLLLLPLGAVGIKWAGRLFFLVDTAAVLAATAIALQLFGLRWRGLAGAIALFGLSLAWPVIYTLDAGNVNGPILLGLAIFLLAAHRAKWLAAGLCLGFTLALKPILAPVLIVVALSRRWPALAAALAVPVVLSAPLLAFVPATRGFFDTTIPLLVHGQNAQIQEASVSLQSAGMRLSVPTPLLRTVELGVLALTLWLVWRRMRGLPDEPFRLVESTSIALVGSFLLSSFAFPHYGVFLLPFAVSLVARPSSLPQWLTFAALFSIGARHGWKVDFLPHDVNRVLSERFTFALLALLASFWLADLRERSTSSRITMGRAP